MARFDQKCQIGSRRHNDADIEVFFGVAGVPTVGHVERVQQLILHMRGQHLHLVEKKRSDRIGAEDSAAGSDGIVKIVARETQKLPGQLGIVEVGAVDRQKAAGGLPASCVNGPGRQFLAAARFSLQGDGAIQGCRPHNTFAQVLHGGCLANNP